MMSESPDESQSQPTRYDPNLGQLYVPLDIRREIIIPLNETRALASSTSKKLDDHMLQATADIAARKAKREKLVTYGRWIGSAAGGVFAVFAALHQAGVF